PGVGRGRRAGLHRGGGAAGVVGAGAVAPRQARDLPGRLRGGGAGGGGRRGDGADGIGARMSTGLVVEEAAEVTPALIAAFARLVPQLSSSAPAPSAEELGEMLAAPGTTVFVARLGDA